MKPQRAIHVVVALFAILAVLACRDEVSQGYPRRNIPQDQLASPTALARGAELFLRLCAACHGHPDEGRTQRADFFVPPAMDFSSATYREVAADYLYWRISAGKTVEPYLSRGSVMPSWGATLSEDDIWSLVAYLRSRSR